MLLLCLASSLLQWSIWLHSVSLLVMVLVLFVRRHTGSAIFGGIPHLVLSGRSLAPCYFDSSNNMQIDRRHEIVPVPKERQGNWCPLFWLEQPNMPAMSAGEQHSSPRFES